MTTPETLSPREVAARQLRERLRISFGPNARAAAEAGIPIALSATEADDAVAIVTAAFVEAGQVVIPTDDLAELAAERDSLKADLDVTRGMLTAARRHADEAKAERETRHWNLGEGGWSWSHSPDPAKYLGGEWARVTRTLGPWLPADAASAALLRAWCAQGHDGNAGEDGLCTACRILADQQDGATP